MQHQCDVLSYSLRLTRNGNETDTMRKNYNFTRRKLYLPEYGRHIQEMVDSLLTIEDRTERTRQAKAVIAVMGNLNPLLRDTADFTHKLWDHLFIMSDFKLDVDSPYPQPARQDLMVKPRPLSYPQSRIAYKHYGKYLGQILKRIGSEHDNPVALTCTIENIARYMRAKSFEYNQEHPNNEILAKDICRLSDFTINIDETALNNARNDYKQNFSAHKQAGKNNKKQQKNNRNQQRPAQKNYQNRPTAYHNDAK